MKTLFKISIFSLSVLYGYFYMGEDKTSQDRVTKVIDGDTFELSGQVIRIAEIDCPELDQPHGAEAKQFVEEIILGEEVSISILKTDRYGRKIADVYFNDKSIPLTLVKAGLAWQYKEYSHSEVLANAENIARLNKKGLWADANPIYPQVWRRNKN